MDPNKPKSRDYQEAIKNVVEHLKQKRSELQCEINKDEVEKAKVLGDMNRLKDKLSVLEANLRKKSEFRKDYDKAINQSEGHFVELMQKSEDFLVRARREALALSQAVGEPSAEGKTKKTPKCEIEPRRETAICGQPAAIISFQPPDSANCVNTPSGFTCTTVAVPYRANGL